MPRLLLPLLSLACISVAGPAAAEQDAASLYDLKFEATPKVAKGAEGRVVVKVLPHKGAEIHKEAPASLELSSTPELAFPKAKATRADLKMDGTKATFELPFVGNAPGKFDVKARLNFVICTDKACTFQTRTESLPVTVTARP